ncbi:YdcF family protein [Caenimonas koreensis]|uniref:YdcF family protein n=1 Tax=Caenimonas koreensis TaxID=367474 RepID=UPI0037849C6A
MLDVLRALVWLASPLPLSLLLAAAAWLLRNRTPARARKLAVASFTVLWMGSMPLTADLLGAPLENYYAPVAVAAAPKADVIVVLGGALVGAHPPQRPNLALGHSADRIWQAAALYRAGKAPWVVVAAGARDPDDDGQVEADAIVEMLLALGVPKERIRAESSSGTTRENASNTRALVAGLNARSVLLVSSAQHLPRAVKAFEWEWRGTGVNVIAFAADVSADDENFTFSDLVPSEDALRHVTRTLKEYAGLCALAIMTTVTR